MLVVIATHPIQYQVPLWRELSNKLKGDFEVWYLTDFGTKESFDSQFGRSFAWDIPLFDGYKYRYLKVNANANQNRGFWGIVIKENIKKLLIEKKVTHVYLNGWLVYANWQILWNAKRLGLKTILKGESNDIKPEVSWKWPIKKLLLSQYFKKIDYFLYIGQANKRLYKRYGVKEDCLYPSLYCVENERFSSVANMSLREKKSLRQKWNIAEDSFCIIFSGKFIDKKRPLDLINAVSKIVSNKVIQILFVGSGTLLDEMKLISHIVFDSGKIVADILPGKVNVSFAGFLNQSEIPQAYGAADCLVLPSNYLETWGLVVNEAMASGIPAIVSNECGCAEDLVLPLRADLVYECGHIQQLVKSIGNLINNPIDPRLIAEHISKFDYSSSINSVKLIMDNV